MPADVKTAPWRSRLFPGFRRAVRMGVFGLGLFAALSTLSFEPSIGLGGFGFASSAQARPAHKGHSLVHRLPAARPGGGRPHGPPPGRPGHGHRPPHFRPVHPGHGPRPPHLRPGHPGHGPRPPHHRPGLRPGGRPIRPIPRRHPFYWGRVVAGVTIGTIIAASVAPPPPAPDICWFWTDDHETHGYWDYCVAPSY